MYTCVEILGSHQVSSPWEPEGATQTADFTSHEKGIHCAICLLTGEVTARSFAYHTHGTAVTNPAVNVP